MNILVDEDILTDGKIDVKKLQAIAFDPAGGKYIALGDAVGNDIPGRQKVYGVTEIIYRGKEDGKMSSE